MDITTEEIVKIHDMVIKESGGHSGMLSYGNMDFIVSQMKIPKTIERKAATLFYGILINHPFLDGNKRTAVGSMRIFLASNGKNFTAKDKDTWIKLHEISEGKLKFEEVLIWIKSNIK
jgi:death-on-curing protein